MNKRNQIKRYGVYRVLGDYHKNLNPKWSYYPLYLEKLKFVNKFLIRNAKGKKILDVGSGDGALVEKYHKQGYNIQGLDLNYSSKSVKKGNITKLPYKRDSFDIVLCLDMLQYLTFKDQERALQEIERVTKKNGFILITVPNMAHFASRVYFLIFGKLLKTDSKKLSVSIGDRSTEEYINLIKRYFSIIEKKGVMPTNFVLSSILIKKFPQRFLWLFRLINLFAYPEWCFLNLFICKK